MTCSIDGCDRPHLARTWCRLHYERWTKFGDVKHVPRRCLSAAERLRQDVATDPATGCWNFTGYVNPVNGYGYLTVAGKGLLVHRIAYEAAKGEIPDGLVIDHLCRNRICVNPDHLDAVPQLLNVHRGQTYAIEANRRGHCKRGHAWPENLEHHKHGSQCKPCRQARQARYKNAA